MAGGALARLGIEFGLALSSPRIRALDTARLTCGALGVEPVVHDALSDGFDSDEALSVLAGQDGDARVLLVGHEPDFSQVVRDLTGASVDLKKGGVAGVRVDGSRHELFVLLRPRELETLSGP